MIAEDNSLVFSVGNGNALAISDVDAGGSPLEAIMNTPMISCDEAQWRLFGISLAGYNFLISLAGGLAALVLLARGRRA